MVALSLCCVASAQINILSVIVFPQEPQSLKKYIFFSFLHFKMEYRSVSYISLQQFPKHFSTAFKVGVKVAFVKKRNKEKMNKKIASQVNRTLFFKLLTLNKLLVQENKK